MGVSRYLIENCNVDVNTKDFFDNTAYDIAKNKNNFEVAAYLSAVAKRVSSECVTERNAVLQCYQHQKKHRPINVSIIVYIFTSLHGIHLMTLLFTFPVRHMKYVFFKKKNMGMTSNPLNLLVDEFVAAAEDGDINKLNKCIHSGVDVEAQNSNAWTALRFACFHGRLHIVKFLIENCDANVNAIDSNGWTALHLTSKFGHLDIVRYLIENCSVDMEATNNVGINALHFASYYGHLNIVQYLVQHCDMDTTFTTIWGATACEIANDNKENSVVDYLKSQPEKVHPKAAVKLRPTSLESIKKSVCSHVHDSLSRSLFVRH